MKDHKPVLVTTKHKGVFFGYAHKDTDFTKKKIALKNARNCIYWRGVKGFLDLASTGPTDSCRVGPAANIILQDITCVAECASDAVKAWEKAPW